MEENKENLIPNPIKILGGLGIIGVLYFGGIFDHPSQEELSDREKIDSIYFARKDSINRNYTHFLDSLERDYIKQINK